MSLFKKTGAAALAALLLTAVTTLPAWAAEQLVPMGCTVGIELMMDGVLVVDTGSVETAGGAVSPAADAGLAPGDLIVEVDGGVIDSADSFLTALAAMDGDPVAVTVLREGRLLKYTVCPASGESGGWAMGLWLRDSVAGIGTVTYYDPSTGCYGALGHGINDVDTGVLMPVRSGKLLASEVTGVVTGSEQSPGELQGRFDPACVRGSIIENTACGIFGTMSNGPVNGALPVASESEIVTGAAVIRSNISGAEVREYSVEITRVYRDDNSGRSLMLTVTDPELLSATGGIVQGMSGSPIIQNGKLIGAVTHVLLSDPSRGYGISIRSMLDASAELSPAA